MRVLVLMTGVVVLDPEHANFTLPAHSKGVTNVGAVINVYALLYMTFLGYGAVFGSLPDLIISPIKD